MHSDPDRSTQASTDQGAAASPPTQAGPYRLLRKLGEGGMGEVYLAAQEEPVRRLVALKIMKASADSHTAIGRFRSERQALALLSHQGIARVFDVGAMDDGRLYFAMEYVEGVAITDYCRAERLGIPERLELLRLACDAVQHAHQKSLIHRDLKPSNILVMRQDGKAIPKIIDFGVAKAIGGDVADQTAWTQAGFIVGTPKYMSPEQASLTEASVDTRTDVYALGVVLYALLVGVTPFDPDDGRSQSIEELLRRIRDEEPVRPSERIAQLGDAARIAEERRSDVGSLRRQIAGDLDWITLRALDKDPAFRYASASELSADLRRNLDDEPVLAGPPSTSYRARKFIRRHRIAVAAGTVVAVSLVLGMIGTGVGMIRAVRAERRAREEAETARQTTAFLTDLFEVSDPGQARGKTVTARELLDRGSLRINEELGSRPVVKARLLETMGNVYRNLGFYDEAGALLRQSLALRESKLGAGHPEVASSLNSLGFLYSRQGRANDALELNRRALQIREAALGRDHLDTGWSMYYLSESYNTVGRYSEARPLLTSALSIFQKELGPDHAAVSWCLNDLGLGYEQEGNFTQAKLYLGQAVDAKERGLGPDHPDVALTLNSLGFMLVESGQYDEAAPFLERALAIQRRALPENHPAIAVTLHSRGEMHRRSGNLGEAMASFEEALAIQRRSLAPDHYDIGVTLQSMADADAALGHVARAEGEYAEALAIYRRTMADDHPFVAACLRSYTALLERAGRSEDAATVRGAEPGMRLVPSGVTP